MKIEITKEQARILSNYEDKGLFRFSDGDFYIISNIKFSPKKPKKPDGDYLLTNITIRTTNLLERKMYYYGGNNEDATKEFLFSKSYPLHKLRRDYLELKRKAEIFEAHYSSVKTEKKI